MFSDKNSMKKISLVLATALVLGSSYTGGAAETAKAKSTEVEVQEIFLDEATASPMPEATATAEVTATPTPEATATATPEVTATPAVTPTPDATPDSGQGFKISDTSIVMMAGKSHSLKVTGATATTLTDESGKSYTVNPVQYSSDSAAVTLSGTSVNGCTIKAAKKGTANVKVTYGEITLTCKVTVVAAMSKTDFGMYASDNFVTRCTKHKWSFGWTGEWVGYGTSKYGSTYRGIKIGVTKSEIEKKYGEFTTKKCSKSKDPFLYAKTFNTSAKKLKVSTYADFNYGKNYKIRVYFTSKNKVYGFILVKNFSKITKFWLSTSTGGGIRMV